MKRDNVDNKMLLSKSLLFALGEKIAHDIQDNCIFEELDINKIGISVKSDYFLNDIDKAKIRNCIKSVYGNDVSIVSVKGKVKNDAASIFTPENLQLSILKNNIQKEFNKRYEDKVGEHIIKNWFDKLQVSALSTPKRLILIGSSFVINWISSNFELELTKAVLRDNFAVELITQENRERPILYSKETIKI